MRSFEDRPACVREQTPWADKDDQGQDRKSKGQVVARADCASSKFEDYAHYHRARHGAEGPAEASRYGRGERDQEEAETEIRVESADALGQDEARVTRDRPCQEECGG